MLSIHNIQSIEVDHAGGTGNKWVELCIFTNEGRTRITLYSPLTHVARVAAGLREVADALEGRAQALPEDIAPPEGVTVVSLDDPEKLHNTLASIFGDK